MNKYEVGKLGEQIVQKYLKNKGFLPILTNYRVRGGEIDLICQKASQLYFIEVKTRTNSSFGYPEESLTYFKKRRFKTAILKYLFSLKKRVFWQAGLVAVELNPSTKLAKIRYYQNLEL